MRSPRNGSSAYDPSACWPTRIVRTRALNGSLAWNELTPVQQVARARDMEVYAAMID